MVTSSRLSAARSWFAAPKSCHRYTQVPDRTRAITAIIPTMVATCWFLNPTHASPSHSPSVTRITRKTSWTTVSTITTNTPNPSAVPKVTGNAVNVTSCSSVPTPSAKALAPAPPATATAVSDRSPSAFSENIPPPPTGRASVSYSSCRAVPTEPMRECHPEIAPQAIVTNSIGHSGMDEHRHHGADRRQADRQRGDPEADVVDRLREPPDRQVGAQVAEDQEEHDPQQEAREDGDLPGLRVERCRRRPFSRRGVGRRDPRIR